VRNHVTPGLKDSVPQRGAIVLERQNQDANRWVVPSQFFGQISGIIATAIFHEDDLIRTFKFLKAVPERAHDLAKLRSFITNGQDEAQHEIALVRSGVGHQDASDPFGQADSGRKSERSPHERRVPEKVAGETGVCVLEDGFAPHQRSDQL